MIKKDVDVLSTVYGSSMVPREKRNSNTSEEILKILSVREYNENRGIVDKSAMQIKFSKCLRKTIKYYKKVVFHIINLSMHNSYILFKHMKHEKFQLSQFKLEIIRDLIAKHGDKRSHIDRPFNVHPLRLTARHFPSLIPPNESNQTPRRTCYVCSNTERRSKEWSDTRYQCTECDVRLCITDFFKDIHTLQKI